MLYIYIYSQTNSRTLAYKPNVAIIDFQNYIICFVDVFLIFHVSWQFAGNFSNQAMVDIVAKKTRPATLIPGILTSTLCLEMRMNLCSGKTGALVINNRDLDFSPWFVECDIKGQKMVCRDVVFGRRHFQKCVISCGER